MSSSWPYENIRSASSIASDSRDSNETVYRKLVRKTIRLLLIRTLDCNRDRIREGVATIISGFSDMIVLDELQVELHIIGCHFGRMDLCRCAVVPEAAFASVTA